MVADERLVSTPGEILLEEFLNPLSISQAGLAEAMGMPQTVVSDIVAGSCAITPGMAWLLSEALGTTPEFWLNLECVYRLKTLDKSKFPKVTRLVGGSGKMSIAETQARFPSPPGRLTFGNSIEGAAEQAVDVASAYSGMSDLQFKSFLKQLVGRMENAIAQSTEGETKAKLAEIIRDLKSDIES